jgi:UDP-glucose 4-epimerase
MALTVAVTGPTGEIGISAVGALEREPDVERIIGMARRPFDPAAEGWTKTTYRQGDILDRDAVDAMVADADVVVHLAFVHSWLRVEAGDEGWTRIGHRWPAQAGDEGQKGRQIAPGLLGS